MSGTILAGLGVVISATSIVAIVKGGRWIKGERKKEEQRETSEKIENEKQKKGTNEDFNDLKDSAFIDWE